MKLINDLKCKMLQKAIYGKLYKGHKPNEWEPWRAADTLKTDDGLICKNDICYSEKYPNSFFDLWYPDDSGVLRPTIVFFHGGGFIFGDKSSGDPLSAGGGAGKLMEMVRHGYNLINANYSLAPEYRFPAQIRQADELFRYLIEHADELGLDMSHVCMAGSSAGANMTVIYAACICNPEYAKQLGINPILTAENLKVLAVDEAALDASVFNGNMYAMLGCWTGAKSNVPDSEISVINAKTYILDYYIPTWVNASNEGGENGYFITEARGIKKKLDAISVPCEMTYFPGETLPHGYMDQLHTEFRAKEAFDAMMAFIQKYI